jgi:hypothetical protein
MNQGAFLMRGLEKVRAEFSLTALAYNLRRALNLVAFPELGSVTSRANCGAARRLSFAHHAACMMRIAMRA